MNSLKLIILTALLPAFLILPQKASKITITGDRLEGIEVNGEKLRTVAGNVVLTQDNIRIVCDSAIQYLERNDAELIGDVVITQENLTIRTPRGFYYGNEKRAFSRNRVELDDKKVYLTAVIGEYLFKQNLAKFENTVELRDSVSTLYCAKLDYYRDSAKAVSVGDVKIVDTENIIEADSLIHYRSLRETYGYGNILIKNQKDNILITGERLADYRLRNYSRIDSLPVLIQPDTSGSLPDTLLMTALVMEAYRDSGTKLIATDSVKMLSNDFASVNDITIYTREPEQIMLYKVNKERPQPVMWVDNSQLTGDTIIVDITARKISLLRLLNNAAIVSVNDTFPLRYDQITGGRITHNFIEGKITRTDIDGNMISIYYLYEEGKPKGLIKSSSVSGSVYFENGRVKDVKLFGTPVSEYHPEKVVRNRERSYLLPRFYLNENKPSRSIFTELLIKNKNLLKYAR